MKKHIILGFLCIYSFLIHAQQYTQTVKGTIYDKDGQYTIPMALVNVVSQGDTLKTSADFDGFFKLENVPVGNIQIIVKVFGYETLIRSNIELTSGKQLDLKLEMTEEVNQLAEVVINSEQQRKQETNNEFSISSTRKFTVEESKRYAGSNQDVSRMASNFAGVQSNNDASNDIVIRGNSPFFVLWRMEDVDIPNPNHFGTLGASGGPISMLNNNYLQNSDFMTGAFTAGYGNALSGAFDLKLRTGNNEKFEYLGQVGFNGFEGGVEGPISRKNKSSFYAGYRYSTLGVLSDLGVNFGTGTAIPYYQDAIFNVHLPTEKAGKFTLFGFGGRSSISFKNAEKSQEESADLYGQAGRNTDFSTVSAAIGLRHLIFVSEKSYIKTTLSQSIMGNQTDIDTLSSDENLYKYYAQNSKEFKTTLHSFYNMKLNGQNLLRLGIIHTVINYDYTDSIYEYSLDSYYSLRDDKGVTGLSQVYANFQHKFSERTKANVGLHSSYFALSKDLTIEPRLSMLHDFTKSFSLNVAYGLHSQSAPINTYLVRPKSATGVKLESVNKKLKLLKSHHIVFGAKKTLGRNMYLKMETYYQHHFDIVSSVAPSSFSLLNFGSFDFDFPDSMSNQGVGRNYGVELTIERFLEKGYYYMFTGSLFDSKYKGSDGVWRNTAFNSNYTLNVVGGKDVKLKDSKKGTHRRITLDTRVNLSGGKYTTPLNLQASEFSGKAVYDDEEAFSKKFQDYFRWDIKIGLVKNHKRITETFALDIQNVLNRKNPYFEVYNADKVRKETVYQVGLFPMLLYRINF